MRKTVSIQITSALLCLFLLGNISFAQEKQRNWSVNGYVSNLQTIMFTHPDSMSLNDNLIHNRINFNWYANNYFTMVIEMRNRFMWGDNVRLVPGYSKFINTYDGVDFLSGNLIDKPSFLLNTTIDRAYFDFTTGNLNITLGRQRINWGRSLVWNPNDLFNTYSFFDFDYIEKPGADALRIQYYTGAASSVEVAVKVDSSERITAAGLARINIASYDFQFLGGLVRENDWMAGTGWEGNIKDFGFRGELSYFQPKKNFSDTSGIFLASLDFDYTFDNSLFIQAEALYDSDPLDLSGGLQSQSLLVTPLGAKDQGFSEFSWFAQASYPLNPLINGNVSIMYFPDLKGFFTGPSLSFSVEDNFDFSLFGQVFSMKTGGKRSNFYIAYLRFKYNF